jgi:hypothetical protein
MALFILSIVLLVLGSCGVGAGAYCSRQAQTPLSSYCPLAHEHEHQCTHTHQRERRQTDRRPAPAPITDAPLCRPPQA